MTLVVLQHSAVPTIPRPGLPVTFEQMETAERQIAASLPNMHDIGEIEDTRDRLKAIEAYLRGKQMHLPALGAQRRLEARIGQLLGPASLDHDRRPGATSAVSDVTPNDRMVFRILARALTDIDLTDDEWRQSRRSLVALIKTRTKEGADLPTSVIEAAKGCRVRIPDGVTAEEWCRKGMAMDLSIEATAAELGIGADAYRKMRDIVALSDRNDLSAKDAALATRALALLNATEQLSQAWPLAEPIADRVWGATKNGLTRDRAEIVRNERFEHAFALMLQACETVAEFDIPYLSEARMNEAIAQVEAASRNLAALKRRISEVRG